MARTLPTIPLYSKGREDGLRGRTVCVRITPEGPCSSSPTAEANGLSPSQSQFESEEEYQSLSTPTAEGADSKPAQSEFESQGSDQQITPKGGTMDFKWIKMRSWHALQHESEQFEGHEDAAHVTYCGRDAEGEIVDILPDEKSCETCLRITSRIQDAIGAL